MQTWFCGESGLSAIDDFFFDGRKKPGRGGGAAVLHGFMAGLCCLRPLTTHFAVTSRSKFVLNASWCAP
jgi:hypothetical protein